MSSQQDLYLELGTAIAEETLGLKPASPKEIAELGRKWFEAAIASIRPVICSSRLSKISADDTGQNMLAAIVDLLLTCKFPAYIPVATVAKLCLDYGIERICQGYE